MNPEQEMMIKELLEVSRENNILLRDAQKRDRLRTGFQIGYWVFILASMYGAWKLFQPYMNTITGNLDQVQTLVKTTNTLNSGAKAVTSPQGGGMNIDEILKFVKENASSQSTQ